MAIMCSLLNYQMRDLEEQRKRQTEKSDAETIEIIVPATIPLIADK
jgi:hypothetical protein